MTDIIAQGTDTRLEHPNDPAAERYVLRAILRQDQVDEHLLIAIHRWGDLTLRRKLIDIARRLITICFDSGSSIGDEHFVPGRDPWTLAAEIGQVASDYFDSEEQLVETARHSSKGRA